MRQSSSAVTAPRRTSGLTWLLAYNVLSSGNEVFLANRLQVVDPPLLLLVVFSITAGSFLALQVRRFRAFLLELRVDRRDVALLNVFSALTWIGYFAALRSVEPAVVTTVAAAVGPVLTIALAPLLRPGAPVARSEVAVAVGIVAALTLLVGSAVTGHSAVGWAATTTQAVGLAASLLAGLAIVLTVLYSKRLYDRAWTPASVMGSRFWLLIGVAAVAVPLGGPPPPVSAADGLTVVAIVVAGTIAPLYCLQLGIERVDPILVAILVSLVPVFTLLLQSFDARLHLSAPSAIGVSLATALVVVAVVLRTRSHRQEGNP